jgi:transcriptional regulator with XRE-family HTH domain
MDQLPIQSVADLGALIRTVRRAGGIRLDDLAATAGVSKQFVSDVERGKPTIRMGLVFKLLVELGIPLRADIREDLRDEWAAARARTARRDGEEDAA